jgi:hypothetical protein
MADTATYDLIASQTLGSAATSITFSSIAASWTDLRLIVTALPSSAVVGNTVIYFNTDNTGTSYSLTYLEGNGTSASSGEFTDNGVMTVGDFNVMSNTIFNNTQIDIFSYAGSTYKTVLSSNVGDFNGSGTVIRIVGLWRSTAVINQIVVKPGGGQFSIGTTAQLYGIKAA